MPRLYNAGSGALVGTRRHTVKLATEINVMPAQAGINVRFYNTGSGASLKDDGVGCCHIWTSVGSQSEKQEKVVNKEAVIYSASIVP